MPDRKINVSLLGTATILIKKIIFQLMVGIFCDTLYMLNNFENKLLEGKERIHEV